MKISVTNFEQKTVEAVKLIPRPYLLRNRRIKFYIYNSFNGDYLGGMDTPYLPDEWLQNRYSKWYKKMKEIINEVHHVNKTFIRLKLYIY